MSDAGGLNGPPPPAAHVPVLRDRVLALLGPALSGTGAVVVDATLGLGGHAEALLRAHPDVTLVGLDRDPEALAGLGLNRVHGVLLDLGVSSMQLDLAERGFAYAQDAPLDMRMDQHTGQTAADIVNTYSAAQLARVIGTFGEERFAGRIASAIVRERAREPFTSTARLAELVRSAIPAATRRTGGHPAKRTFQALRIEVNGELDALAGVLPAAIDALAVHGRIVVMSYHSLEDRLVKQALAPLTKDTTPLGLPVSLPGSGPQLRLLTRGAEEPTEAEIEQNPRAASARLRAAERIREAA